MNRARALRVAVSGQVRLCIADALLGPNTHFGPAPSFRMTNPIATYLHDHLAGARFAVSLLQDLSRQSVDAGVSDLATSLIPEIEADQNVLEGFTKQIDGDSSTIKEVAAWVA